jgi:hypothetical protein
MGIGGAGHGCGIGMFGSGLSIGAGTIGKSSIVGRVRIDVGSGWFHGPGGGCHGLVFIEDMVVGGSSVGGVGYVGIMSTVEGSVFTVVDGRLRIDAVSRMEPPKSESPG